MQGILLEKAKPNAFPATIAYLTKIGSSHVMPGHWFWQAFFANVDFFSHIKRFMLASYWHYGSRLALKALAYQCISEQYRLGILWAGVLSARLWKAISTATTGGASQTALLSPPMRSISVAGNDQVLSPSTVPRQHSVSR